MRWEIMAMPTNDDEARRSKGAKEHDIVHARLCENPVFF